MAEDTQPKLMIEQAKGMAQKLLQEVWQQRTEKIMDGEDHDLKYSMLEKRCHHLEVKLHQAQERISVYQTNIPTITENLAHNHKV